MGYFAGNKDLRNFLAVAAKLRRLADDTLHREDKNLYLAAAAVLEARAERMASHPPDGSCDPGRDAGLHRPVNLLV